MSQEAFARRLQDARASAQAAREHSWKIVLRPPVGKTGLQFVDSEASRCRRCGVSMAESGNDFEVKGCPGSWAANGQ